MWSRLWEKRKGNAGARSAQSLTVPAFRGPRLYLTECRAKTKKGIRELIPAFSVRTSLRPPPPVLLFFYFSYNPGLVKDHRFAATACWSRIRKIERKKRETGGDLRANALPFSQSRILSSLIVFVILWSEIVWQRAARRISFSIFLLYDQD